MAPATTTTNTTNLSANLCTSPPHPTPPTSTRTHGSIVGGRQVLAPVPARGAIDLSINRQIAWIRKLFARRRPAASRGHAVGLVPEAAFCPSSGGTSFISDLVLPTDADLRLAARYVDARAAKMTPNRRHACSSCSIATVTAHS